MVPTSTKLLPFTPPWLEGKPNAPRYLLQPGGVVERSLFEAELASPPYNAGRVYDVQLYEAARDGVRAWATGDDLARLLELIDAHQGGQLKDGSSDMQMFLTVEAALRDKWPTYAALCAQRSRRQECLPLLAVQRFLRGWENVDKPFKANFDGSPSPETLAAIPPLELRVVGLQAWSLLYVSEEAAGESAAPSKSAQDQETSPSVSSRRTPRKGGRSTAGSGRKTRS